jgi:hypothetical protein
MFTAFYSILQYFTAGALKNGWEGAFLSLRSVLKSIPRILKGKDNFFADAENSKT